MTCRNEKGQQKTSQDRKKLEQPVVVHCTANGFQKCHRNQLSLIIIQKYKVRMILYSNVIKSF